jgi:Putative transposase
VSFRWKDYRIEGPARWKTMTLTSHEFIRRFLIHVLPKDFHRIRHYGLFANTNRVADIARARELLGAAPPAKDPGEQKAVELGEPRVLPCPCPHCGGRMIVIEVFARGCVPRYRPALHATTRPVVQTTLDVLHWIEVTIAAVDSPREKKRSVLSWLDRPRPGRVPQQLRRQRPRRSCVRPLLLRCNESAANTSQGSVCTVHRGFELTFAITEIFGNHAS